MLRPPRSPFVASVPAAALLVALLGLSVGCTPPTSDGGQVVVTTDDRIEEVRAAREVLAEPVPALVAEAERLVAALASLWTDPASSIDRGERAQDLRLTPLDDAVAALDATELVGRGPDVEAARAVRDDMLADARAVRAAVEEEVATLAALPPYDAELEELLAGWDARGSYSQQLAAFEELAVEAEELAATAADRTATPACTEVWARRSAAATTVAERTEELRVLIRDRRGQEFDELRDEFRQDPYGLGSLFVELDAAAAEACWTEASQAPVALAALQQRTEELATVLDPEDLRG